MGSKRPLAALLSTTLTVLLGTIDALAYPCTPGLGQIAVSEHTNFGGSCKTLGYGNYANSSAFGFGDDKISLVIVGPRARATLY